MAKVLLTTIGLGQNKTGLYHYTRYQFPDGRKRRSKYFPGALAAQIRPDAIIVLLTKEARRVTWQENGMERYMKRLNAHVITCDIPDGQNEDELWTIFNKFAVELVHDHALHDAQVVLDITHALRSLPIVAMNALGYLQQIRLLHLDSIYYAAFEAASSPHDPKPVFRLEASLLLDWGNAVATFKRTGDSSLIGQLLHDRQNEFYRDTASPASERPTRLKNVAATLKTLSLALDLARPVESMDAAYRLSAQLQAARHDTRFAPPFAILAQQIDEEFQSFALDRARAEEDIAEFLSKNLVLIRWCRKQQRFTAAILMAREWLVSWYGFYRLGKRDIFNQECRQSIENCIYTEQEGDSIHATVRDLFARCSDIRNDIAHAGMREAPKAAESLATQIDVIVDSLEKVEQCS